MKKILFLLSVLVFVATLFIGCPPHINPPKPPEQDTTNTPDTIIIPPDDSLYNYVSEAYLKNYFPFDTGAKFLFVYEGVDHVDSLVLTLQFKDFFHYFHRSDCLAPKQEINLSDKNKVDTCFLWYYIEDILFSVSYGNLSFDLFVSSYPMKDDSTVMVDYSFENPHSSFNSGGYTCECDSKECVSETCFPTEIKVYNDDEKEKICLVIEQGKGVTQFLGENDKMWRLDSIVK